MTRHRYSVRVIHTADTLFMDVMDDDTELPYLEDPLGREDGQSFLEESYHEVEACSPFAAALGLLDLRMAPARERLVHLEAPECVRRGFERAGLALHLGRSGPESWTWRGAVEEYEFRVRLLPAT